MQTAAAEKNIGRGFKKITAGSARLPAHGATATAPADGTISLMVTPIHSLAGGEGHVLIQTGLSPGRSLYGYWLPGSANSKATVLLKARGYGHPAIARQHDGSLR